jgi:hypothetical protein
VWLGRALLHNKRVQSKAISTQHLIYSHWLTHPRVLVRSTDDPCTCQQTIPKWWALHEKGVRPSSQASPLAIPTIKSENILRIKKERKENHTCRWIDGDDWTHPQSPASCKTVNWQRPDDPSSWSLLLTDHRLLAVAGRRKETKVQTNYHTVPYTLALVALWHTVS